MSQHGNRKLNKPFRTPTASKKFGVFVRNKKTGRVQIVRFGSKTMTENFESSLLGYSIMEKRI